MAVFLLIQGTRRLTKNVHELQSHTSATDVFITMLLITRNHKKLLK